MNIIDTFLALSVIKFKLNYGRNVEKYILPFGTGLTNVE